MVLGKPCWRPSLAKSRPVQIVGKTVLAPESCKESPGPDSWKNNVGAQVLHRVARSRKLEKQCWHPSLAQSRPVQGVGKNSVGAKPLAQSRPAQEVGKLVLAPEAFTERPGRAKPALEQRHVLFRQNKLQTAISSASQAGIGATALFISPK